MPKAKIKREPEKRTHVQSALVSERFLMVCTEIIAMNKINRGHIKSLKVLADMIHANYSQLNQIGKIGYNRYATLEMCVNLCAKFGVDANWLFTGEGAKYRNQEISQRLQILEEKIDELDNRLSMYEHIGNFPFKKTK